VPWDKRFAEPIVLEDGSKLATLQDAIAHLARLIPKAERDMPEILTAAELLTNAAAHGGPIEFARIATLQAIDLSPIFHPAIGRALGSFEPVWLGDATGRGAEPST
jgi:hypothetical protein